MRPRRHRHDWSPRSEFGCQSKQLAAASERKQRDVEFAPSLGGNLPSLGGQSHGSLQTQSVKSQFSQDTGLGRSLLNVMDQIVAHLLTQQPVDSTNKPTGTTVYLQYQTGQGVDTAPVRESMDAHGRFEPAVGSAERTSFPVAADHYSQRRHLHRDSHGRHRSAGFVDGRLGNIKPG